MSARQRRSTNQSSGNRTHLSTTNPNNILSSLFPLVLRHMDVPREGAHLGGGGGDTRHEAEVTLEKSICSQRRSVSIFGSIFFFLFHVNVLNSLSSFHQTALWIRRAFVSIPRISRGQNKQTNTQTTIMTRECSINDCRHTVINYDFYRRDAANQHSRVGIPHKSRPCTRSSKVNC